MKRHLIISSAVLFDKSDSITREADYFSSFMHALKFKEDFDSMHIVEAYASPIPLLDNSEIDVYYSKRLNKSLKSMDELTLIWDFIKQDFIAEDDIIVKITGRYLLVNLNILSHITDDLDFVAKDESDIYTGDRGVHTFLWASRKRLYRQYQDYGHSVNPKYVDISNPKESIQLEHFTKDFMVENSEKTKIIPHTEKIGCITCIKAFGPEYETGAIPNFIRRYV